jgi:hypothetical protein
MALVQLSSRHEMIVNNMHRPRALRLERDQKENRKHIGQSADQGRGPADCSEYHEVAGVVAQVLMINDVLLRT